MHTTFCCGACGSTSGCPCAELARPVRDEFGRTRFVVQMQQLQQQRHIGTQITPPKRPDVEAPEEATPIAADSRVSSKPRERKLQLA